MVISDILGGYYGLVGLLHVNFTMMSHKNTISIFRSTIFSPDKTYTDIKNTKFLISYS